MHTFLPCSLSAIPIVTVSVVTLASPEVTAIDKM